MHCDTAHTAQIHHIFAAPPEEGVDARTKKLDGEPIKVAFDAGGPESRHADTALERGVEVAFIAVGGAVDIGGLELEGGHLICVEIGGTEDST